MGALVITNSKRCTFLDCQYRYFLEYERRLSPVSEAAYFVWGALIHECLEAVDNGISTENFIEGERTRIEESTEILTEKQITQMDLFLNLLQYVMDAYLLKYYEKDLARYETLGAERIFELELPSGAIFKGKIDRVVRDTVTGETYIWEIKTAAMTGDTYWQAIQIGSQPIGYLLAAQRCYGFQVTKVIYDVLKKPQIRQKVHEPDADFYIRVGEAYLLGRDKYFERRPITKTQQQIDTYYYEIDQVARDIMWHTKEGSFAMHHPTNKKGGCCYYPICVNGEHSEAEDMFYMRNVDKTEPEL